QRRSVPRRTVTVPLCSQANASPFWIMLLLGLRQIRARNDPCRCEQSGMMARHWEAASTYPEPANHFVARLLADLLHLIGGGIVGSMPSSRTQQQTADLFQAAGAQESCRTHTPARLTSAQQSAAVVSAAEKLSSRHVLPRDPSNALQRLAGEGLGTGFRDTQTRAATCRQVARKYGGNATDKPCGNRAACVGSINNNGRIPRAAAATRTQCRVDTRPGQCSASSVQGGNHTFPHSETVRDLPVRRAQGAGVGISKGRQVNLAHRTRGCRRNATARV